MQTTIHTAQDTNFFMTAADVQETYGVSLVTAETLRNGFIEVTRQMHASLLRSAFSNVVRDSMDFGVCVHLVCPDGTTDLVAITEAAVRAICLHPSAHDQHGAGRVWA